MPGERRDRKPSSGRNESPRREQPKYKKNQNRSKSNKTDSNRSKTPAERAARPRPSRSPNGYNSDGTKQSKGSKKSSSRSPGGARLDIVNETDRAAKQRVKTNEGNGRSPSPRRRSRGSQNRDSDQVKRDRSPRKVSSGRPEQVRDRKRERGRDSSPERGRDSGPERGRDSGPERGRNSGPERGRDSGPERGRDRKPERVRDRSPGRSRKKSLKNTDEKTPELNSKGVERREENGRSKVKDKRTKGKTSDKQTKEDSPVELNEIKVEPAGGAAADATKSATADGAGATDPSKDLHKQLGEALKQTRLQKNEGIQRPRCRTCLWVSVLVFLAVLGLLGYALYNGVPAIRELFSPSGGEGSLKEQIGNETAGTTIPVPSKLQNSSETTKTTRGALTTLFNIITTTTIRTVQSTSIPVRTTRTPLSKSTITPTATVRTSTKSTTVKNTGPWPTESNFRAWTPFSPLPGSCSDNPCPNGTVCLQSGQFFECKCDTCHCASQVAGQTCADMDAFNCNKFKDLQYKLPDPKDCSKYIWCNYGIPQRDNPCAPGSVFNPQKLACDFPDEAPCSRQ